MKSYCSSNVDAFARAVASQIASLLGVVEPTNCALEAVMDRLRDLKERLVAADQPPVRHQALIVEQWHDRPEQLGHASSVGSGVDVENPSATQSPSGILDSIEDLVRSDASVRRERVLADIDELEQGTPRIEYRTDKSSMALVLAGVGPSKHPRQMVQQYAICA